MVTALDISYRVATAENDFADGRSLFQQYAGSLDFDLQFQGFSNELDEIHRQYGGPSGSLIIAYDRDHAFACAGIRAFSETNAELKRMFVQPAYRGRQVARKLLELAIAEAQRLGYKKILLDTVPGMKQAIQLYYAFGFIDTAPYRFNPNPDALFMERDI